MVVPPVLAVGLYLLVIAIAVYIARKQGWGRYRRLGWATFLVGTGLGVFLEDILAVLGTGGTDLFPVEMAGIAIMMGGLLVYSRAKSRNANPA